MILYIDNGGAFFLWTCLVIWMRFNSFVNEWCLVCLIDCHIHVKSCNVLTFPNHVLSNMHFKYMK